LFAKFRDFFFCRAFTAVVSKFSADFCQQICLQNRVIVRHVFAKFRTIKGFVTARQKVSKVSIFAGKFLDGKFFARNF
jgi:hypothetical protein